MKKKSAIKFSKIRYVVKKINKFVTFISTRKNKEKNKIKQSGLDSFFITISEFMCVYLNFGISELDYKNICFENKYTKKYFITAFSCLVNGVDIFTLEIVLSYMKVTIIRNKSISQQELLEIALLEKILKLIQQRQVDEYLFFIIQFCSSEQYNRILDMFKILNKSFENKYALNLAD